MLFSVYVKEDKLFFGPAEKAKEIFELEYGKSLLSFTPEINTANQVGSVTVIGYEPKKKKAVVGKAERKPDKPGKNGVWMEKIVGNVRVKVTNRSATNKQQASMLAKSILEESSAGLLKGSAKSIGIPDIRVGTKIRLSGLGDTFSRKYFIEKTKHSIDTSGYSTDFSVRRDFSVNVSS